MLGIIWVQYCFWRERIFQVLLWCFNTLCHAYVDATMFLCTLHVLVKKWAMELYVPFVFLLILLISYRNMMNSVSCYFLWKLCNVRKWTIDRIMILVKNTRFQTLLPLMFHQYHIFVWIKVVSFLIYYYYYTISSIFKVLLL